MSQPIDPRVQVILIDDDPHLRQARYQTLDLAGLHVLPLAEANGLAERIGRDWPGVVVSDIRMPGMDGIELAGHLGAFEHPPAVIFTTAYDNYAVQAFDLNAVDYLLKPVRAQRLLAALQKVPAQHPDPVLLAGLGQQMRGGGRTHLSCHERGRLLLVPVSEVLYFKADLKYVTARSIEREYLLDEALTHLETEFAERFIRLHRAVLVAKTALAGFEKGQSDDADAYGWALLRGVPEKLPVSRRQWVPAKALVKNI